MTGIIIFYIEGLLLCMGLIKWSNTKLKAEERETFESSIVISLTSWVGVGLMMWFIKDIIFKFKIREWWIK